MKAEAKQFFYPFSWASWLVSIHVCLRMELVEEVTIFPDGSWWRHWCSRYDHQSEEGSEFRDLALDPNSPW
jgi:hypothetical protein